MGGATFRGGRANWGGRQTNGRGFGARESLERKEEVRRPERFWVSDDEGGCIFGGRGGSDRPPRDALPPFSKSCPCPSPGLLGPCWSPDWSFLCGAACVWLLLLLLPKLLHWKLVLIIMIAAIARGGAAAAAQCCKNSILFHYFLLYCYMIMFLLLLFPAVLVTIVANAILNHYMSLL